MRRSTAFLVLLTSALVPPVFAHEPETLPPSGRSPIQPIPAKLEDSGAQSDHLLKAVQHLESAGLKEEAQRLRIMARDRVLRENVIAQKEAELDCLTTEIDELRRLTGQPRYVFIYITALEYSRTALGEKRAIELDRILGRNPQPAALTEGAHEKRTIFATGNPGYAFNEFDASSLNENRRLGATRRDDSVQQIGTTASATDSLAVDSNPLVHPFVRQLREQGLLKIVAEPTMVTISGRPTSFHQGGLVPVKAPTADGLEATTWMPFGVLAEARATVLPGQRVRLRAKLDLREKWLVCPSDTKGNDIPTFSSRGVNADLELRLGQTAIAAKLSFCPTKIERNCGGVIDRLLTGLASVTAASSDAEKRPADELCEFVVFVSAESADANSTPPQAVELIPHEISPDEMRQLLTPAGVPDDVQYFPPSPIPRKGTLR